MSFSDWLLALHLPSAFALVAALVLYTAVMVANWGADRPQRASAYFRLAAIGGPLVGAGAGLALLFGIALAIDLDAYQPWDGWILLSIVLWAIGAATGSRVGTHDTGVQGSSSGSPPRATRRAPSSPRSSATAESGSCTRSRWSRSPPSCVLMIFKPGA